MRSGFRWPRLPLLPGLSGGVSSQFRLDSLEGRPINPPKGMPLALHLKADGPGGGMFLAIRGTSH
jgi:hypothetical protein